MNVIRTAILVLITALVVGFVVLNLGEPQEVRIWPGGTDAYVVDWPAGFVPMWLYHRGVKWGLNRRIAALENAARVNAVVAATPPPPPQPVSPEPYVPLDSGESTRP